MSDVFKSEKEFERNIDKMFDNIKHFNLTDVIVCVHPFSDALYESKISLSRRNTSIASLLTWSISIISYYMCLKIYKLICNI